MYKLNFDTSLFKPNTTVIVGLSGGPDSVCLLHYLITQTDVPGLRIIAAHLDHGWRATSEQDALFCKKLCEELEIEFVSKNTGQVSFKPKKDGSKESAGRQLRRYFFEKTAEKFEAESIVLAHHLDDQVETFFIRLMRGTTVSGLGCIKAQDGNYLRPLLQATKQDILNYCDQNLLSYVQDPTNNSDAFLRNRIRNTLIPVLKECDERSEQQIIRTINQLQETEQFLETLTEKTFSELSPDQKLDLKKFRELEPFLQKRIVSLWLCNNAPAFTLTESFIQEIIRFLLNQDGGKHQLGATWSIIKKEQKAIITLQ